MKSLKQLLTGLVLAAMVQATQATTVIDSLNDINTNANITTWGAVNGTSLRSDTGPTAGGIGFLSGFTQTSGVLVYSTNDLAVALTNYVSGQAGTVRHWSVGAVTTSSGYARRTQARTMPSMSASGSGVIWFSFLVSLNTTNGEAALCFNPYLKGTGVTGNDPSGTPNGYAESGGGPGPQAPGLRIGLGGMPVGVQGALGIGPIETTNTDCGLTNITVNGSNGVVTAANFVPRNGTAGLVLGCIYTDSGSGAQAVNVWYNPDVTNQASLPPPTLTFIDTNALFVPSSISSIGYQLCRDNTAGVRNAIIDNVKVSDEANGFNIVYQNAALPTPLISVVVSNAYGSASTPSSNIVFNVESSMVVSGSPLVVSYALSGSAQSGEDYTDALGGSATIPVGQSNVLVSLVPIAENVPESTESAIITLQGGTGYTLGGASSATGYILSSNAANVSVQYILDSLQPQVWDPNLIASAAGVAGIGGSQNFSSTYKYSEGRSYLVPETVITNSEAGAVADGNYMSILIAPVVGRSMALTNLNFEAVYGNYLDLDPSASGAGIVVRSSLDNFTTDLASFALQPDTATFPVVFQNYNLDLGDAFTNLPGYVEFRFYFYSDGGGTSPQVGIYLNNLYFSGSTIATPGVSQVSVAATVPNAAEPSTSGQFTLTRTGSTANALAVYYNLSGTASDGVDYAYLSGVANIPAGQSNVVVTVAPTDSYFMGSNVTVVLTLSGNSNYGVGFQASATVAIATDGQLPPGVLLSYEFNENNNSASSLSAVAAATVRAGFANEVSGSNAVAGSGFSGFGAAGGSGQDGYSSSTFVSGPSSLWFDGWQLGTNATQAQNLSKYFSFTIQPQSGYALTLTNFSAWVSLNPNVGDTNVFFLRSSADNFTSDLGTITVIYGTAFTQWNVPLAVTSSTSSTEYRIYAYATSQVAGAFFVHIDDVAFYGSVTNAAVSTNPPVMTSISISNTNVVFGFTGSPSDTASLFHVASSPVVAGPYVDDGSATITGSNRVFQVVIPMNGPARFYRVHR